VTPRRASNGLNYRATDAALVANMRTLITAGEARSPENAARSVCSHAEGHGGPESKVKRLAKRYRKAYPAIDRA
jgi:hypothetical protein